MTQQCPEIPQVTVVSDWMNAQEWWSKGKADLTCLDRPSAEKVAEAYWMVFTAYPELVGRFEPPDTSDSFEPQTYAICYYDTGRMSLNPEWWNDYERLSKRYQHDVATNWHPQGTDARAIIVHELGHAVDGLLTNSGVAGGYDRYWDEHAASEELLRQIGEGTGVSRYAETDPREWFSEAFAEYVCSENPRPPAKEFGIMLDRYLERLEHGKH